MRKMLSPNTKAIVLAVGKASSWHRDPAKYKHKYGNDPLYMPGREITVISTKPAFMGKRGMLSVEFTCNALQKPEKINLCNQMRIKVIR